MGFSSVSWLREYKHTRLSKVHVSGYVSHIYNRLVKERMSYALHNGRGLIIMQMRTKVGKLEHKLLEGRRRGKPC